VATPTILRSYPDPPQRPAASREWLIREAARATSAAPTYFPPLDVGGGYKFVDAGAFGFNNPTSLVLREAEQIPEFRGRRIGCIVSLGTGLVMFARPVGPSLSSANEVDSKAQRLVENAKKTFKAPKVAYDRLKKLTDDLVSVATNTEQSHHSFYWATCEYDDFSEFVPYQTNSCIAALRSSHISV
jgi:hypothetical protein